MTMTKALLLFLLPCVLSVSRPTSNLKSTKVPLVETRTQQSKRSSVLAGKLKTIKALPSTDGKCTAEKNSYGNIIESELYLACEKERKEERTFGSSDRLCTNYCQECTSACSDCPHCAPEVKEEQCTKEHSSNAQMCNCIAGRHAAEGVVCGFTSDSVGGVVVGNWEIQNIQRADMCALGESIKQCNKELGANNVCADETQLLCAFIKEGICPTATCEGDKSMFTTTVPDLVDSVIDPTTVSALAWFDGLKEEFNGKMQRCGCSSACPLIGTYLPTCSISISGMLIKTNDNQLTSDLILGHNTVCPHPQTDRNGFLCCLQECVSGSHMQPFCQDYLAGFSHQISVIAGGAPSSLSESPMNFMDEVASKSVKLREGPPPWDCQIQDACENQDQKCDGSFKPCKSETCVSTPGFFLKIDDSVSRSDSSTLMEEVKSGCLPLPQAGQFWTVRATQKCAGATDRFVEALSHGDSKNSAQRAEWGQSCTGILNALQSACDRRLLAQRRCLHLKLGSSWSLCRPSSINAQILMQHDNDAANKGTSLSELESTGTNTCTCTATNNNTADSFRHPIWPRFVEWRTAVREQETNSASTVHALNGANTVRLGANMAAHVTIIDTRVDSSSASAFNVGAVLSVNNDHSGDSHHEDANMMLGDNDVVINFATSKLVTTENAAAISIPVRRGGFTQPPIRVYYKTEDGTAKKGIDYVATSGTVTFKQHQTLTSIDVVLIQHAAIKENRAFSVKLFLEQPEMSADEKALDDMQRYALSHKNDAITTVADTERAAVTCNCEVWKGQVSGKWLAFDHITAVNGDYCMSKEAIAGNANAYVCWKSPDLDLGCESADKPPSGNVIHKCEHKGFQKSRVSSSKQWEADPLRKVIGNFDLDVEVGQRGATGPQGAQGNPGANGVKGVKGNPGDVIEDTASGNFAYTGLWWKKTSSCSRCSRQCTRSGDYFKRLVTVCRGHGTGATICPKACTECACEDAGLHNKCCLQTTQSEAGSAGNQVDEFGADAAFDADDAVAPAYKESGMMPSVDTAMTACFDQGGSWNYENSYCDYP